MYKTKVGHVDIVSSYLITYIISQLPLKKIHSSICLLRMPRLEYAHVLS